MILYDSIVYEMYNLIILAMSQLLLEGILNLYIAKNHLSVLPICNAVQNRLQVASILGKSCGLADYWIDDSSTVITKIQFEPIWTFANLRKI